MRGSFSRFAATALCLSVSLSVALASQGPGAAPGDAGFWAQSSAKVIVGLLAVIVIFGAIKFAIRRFGAS